MANPSLEAANLSRDRGTDSGIRFDRKPYPRQHWWSNGQQDQQRAEFVTGHGAAYLSTWSAFLAASRFADSAAFLDAESHIDHKTAMMASNTTSSVAFVSSVRRL
jgi:hypothetical protein